MILLFFISIGLGIGYIYLLQWITEGWESCESTKINTSSTKVSVIIAARNEELYIAKRVDSIYTMILNLQCCLLILPLGAICILWSRQSDCDYTT